MASNFASVSQQKAVEDPLAYLPCSTVMEYKKGEIIYGHDQAPGYLYLVLTGSVKITRLATRGQQLLLDLYRTDDFFGESVLLNLPPTGEEASCHQPTTLMAWRTSDIEDIIMKRPRLAVALLQAFGRRSLGFARRIESLSFDPVNRRLARSLIRFSERMGSPQSDGSIVMDPITHELLAQYVGTSREVVTCHMKAFRRLGCLQYSRKAIVVHPNAMNSWLEEAPGSPYVTG